jgi:outer membrane protein OmpA-like peptidoglycan-associated protein
MSIFRIITAARALASRCGSLSGLKGCRAGIMALLLATLLTAILPGSARAQQVLSVPFNDGFIGKDDGSPNTAVQTYTFSGVPGLTGGIDRAFFSQNLTSSATEFQSCNGTTFLYGATLNLCGAGAQGNDVPGFLTLVDSSGTAYRFAGFYQFRGPSNSSPDQNSTYVFIVLEGGTVGSLTLVPGAIDTANTNTNYSLIGTVLNGKRNATTVTSATDGDGSFSGNAASNSVLVGLRSYYTATVAARPAGPVSVVAQTTADTTPTITGSVTLDSSKGEYLTVTVNGVTYTQGDGNLTVEGNTWTLNIPTATPTGTYDVDALIYNASGYILGDSTSGELKIVAPVASISVVKVGKLNDDDGTDGLSAGDTISYTFTVKNTGGLALTNVTVTDPLVTVEGGPLAVLLPGETDSTTFTASYVLTDSNIEDGQVTNQATAKGTYEDTDVSDLSGTAFDNDTATVTSLAGQASISVVKSGTLNDNDGTDGLSVGDTISYTFTVKNTGTLPLTNVIIADPLVTVEGNIGVLQPGAEDSTTLKATYVLTQEDIDAGKVTNQAEAIASSPNGDRDVKDTSGTAADNDTATVTDLPGRSPALKITKSADVSDLTDGVRAGDEIVYTIEIENTGNVTLIDLQLTDSFTDADGGSLALTTEPKLPGDTLAPGEKWTLSASFTLTDAVIAKGGVTNLATISGTAPDGSTVTAESKVGGNTSADGKDTPTDTGFPGEISGKVMNNLAGAGGVTVTLLKETSPGSGQFEPVLDRDGNPVTTVTNPDGSYTFLNLPPYTYGVEFQAPNPGAALAASSPTATASGNRITGITVDNGSVQIDHDAFFVDPAGVVYDSETFAPIADARVTLLFNGAPVPDDWLNTAVGDVNGTVTGADGRYFFLLDPAKAPSGTYTLLVEKTGYKPSESVPPQPGSYTPGLGGGVEPIVTAAEPASGQPQTYYMSFAFTFTADPATTSNGISNNHIPLDARLSQDITQDLTDILQKDLAATMMQQADRMQGYAKGALDRLKSRDGDACSLALDAVLDGGQIGFQPGTATLAAESNRLLDRLGEVLASCSGQIEVAAHANDQGDAAANLALSQKQADAVVAALVARSVPAQMLTAKGYGDTRPIADTATATGRAANNRVEFALLNPEEAPCISTTTSEHDLAADVHGDTGTVDGQFTHESHSCATDSWRIVSGDVSILQTDDGIDQSLANLSIRTERFVTDNRVRGRFVGAYLSRSEITGTADGTILGFGLNAGLYGADRLADGMFLDYYLGAAAGRHRFDLDFARAGGAIDATGHYTYGALFAGLALSGETHIQGLAVSPRAGLDLAWSPGGNASLQAARGDLTDSDSLSVPGVMGGRGFLELQFNDLLADSPITLSVTPRLLCDWGTGGLSLGCGYGGTIDLTSEADQDGAAFGLTLDGSRVQATTTGRIELRYERPLGPGRIEGGLQAGTGGDLGVQAGYKVNF